MESPLLSIVVPTKDRDVYLKSFIDIVCDFDSRKVELVVQDNSKSENGIRNYIDQKQKNNIHYYYDGTPMPVIDNSSLAISHSKGKYVCFMGDDDLLSYRIVEFTELMDQYGIDCASFKTSTYSWPGVIYQAHKFPNLMIEHFKEKIQRVSPSEEREQLLKRGGVSLDKMPQLYHGIVKRSCLEEIYQTCGTYFPGPSPDMAVATALSYVVNNIVFCNIPIITSGKSPKSAAGLGAKHQHKGKLADMSFLPADIETKWNDKLPKIWTGPTIYGQSIYEALSRMKQTYDLKRFNYGYFYAYFFIFCNSNREYLRAAMKKATLPERTGFILNIPLLFLFRTRVFIHNRVRLKLRTGIFQYDGVPNTYEAEKIIDSHLDHVNLMSIFQDCMGGHH